MKNANIITCKYSIGKTEFRFDYSIDDNFNDYIKIIFPFEIDEFDGAFHDYLGTSLAILLASMTLAKEIKTEFAFKQNANFSKILKILYDVRCYSEDINFVDIPKIVSKSSKNNKIDFNVKKQNSILFWSGGIDSTYSQILLTKNKYNTFLVHSNINVDQKNTESKAVKYLSEKMNIDVELLMIEFPLLKDIGKTYSKKFNKFPFFNSIPFGRDIIHIFAGLYYCKKHKSKYLCFGHEYELWKNYIDIDGRLICRNDLQSEYASIEINKILKNINKDLHLFSPIAATSKLYIFKALLEHDEEILNMTTSCYFGNNCGECNNCLLYSVLDKITKNQKATLKEFQDVVLDAENTSPRETFADILYLYFYDIIQCKKDEAKFKDVIMFKFGHLLHKNKKEIVADLGSIKKVKLIPRDFKYNNLK